MALRKSRTYQKPYEVDDTPSPDTEREGADTTHKKTNTKGSLMIDILTGDILNNEKVMRSYYLMLYIAVLVLLYISYVFMYQRVQRNELTLKIELREERSRALIFESTRMNASRHSSIMKEIKRRGLDLEESDTPPKVIERVN